MKVNAHDILNIDTISKGNDKPWDKLINFMNEHPEENIEFDFYGVEVYQPCNSTSFLKLLANPKFSMTLHNSPAVARSIQLMCALNSQDETRIKNITAEVIKEEPKEDKKIREMAAELVNGYFETANNRGTLYINRRFDQIGVPKTVDYIREALKMYVNSTGIKDLVLYTGGMSIQTGVIEMVANLVDDLRVVGANLKIISDDETVKTKLGMYRELVNANYSESERLAIIKNRLFKGKVGILYRYKEGKAHDEFGRQGKGEVLSVRVAIFCGIRDNGGEIEACFRCFNGNKLYTKDHWYLEHDGEILTKLEYNTVMVPISQLGIYNDFIGSKYHFSSPVQYNHQGTVRMYYTKPDGSVGKEDLTIPERIKAVFDDFSEDAAVSYNKEYLDSCILKTKEHLNR